MSQDFSADALWQFRGAAYFFPHPVFEQIIYTPGIYYLGQEGNANWLIDEIAAYLVSPAFNEAAQKEQRLLRKNFWHLAVHQDQSATLTGVAEAEYPPFFTREIEQTDFSLEEVEVWAGANDRGGFMLLLPCEH